MELTSESVKEQLEKELESDYWALCLSSNGEYFKKIVEYALNLIRSGQVFLEISDFEPVIGYIEGENIYLKVNRGIDLKTIKFFIFHEVLHSLLQHERLTREFSLNYEVSSIAFDAYINSFLQYIDKDSLFYRLYDKALREDNIIFRELKKPLWLNYNELDIYYFLEDFFRKNPSYYYRYTLKLNQEIQKILKIDNQYVRVGISESRESDIEQYFPTRKKIVSLFSTQILEWKKAISLSIRNREKELLSFKRPHLKRTYLLKENGIFVPSKTGEKLINIFVVVDTSASISDEALEEFWAFIHSLKKHNYRIVEIQHDLFIRQVLLHENGKTFKASIKNGRVVKKETAEHFFLGRTGTSHREVFDTIYLFKDNSVFVFLTDGYSDIKEHDYFSYFARHGIWLTPHKNSLYHLLKMGILKAYLLRGSNETCSIIP